jgi:hypothetical protein
MDIMLHVVHGQIHLDIMADKGDEDTLNTSVDTDGTP